jgi:pentatricopeptide repeat protein
MFPYVQTLESIQEVGAVVAQEVLVLTIFGASYFLWRRVQNRYKRRSLKFNALQLSEKCKAAKNHIPVKGNWPLRRAEQALDEATHKRVQDGEVQIFRLLQLREFTSALNMYRSFERESLDRHFTKEAMYDSFIQSAIRVNKIDVVERMLKLMMRNGVEPSLEFWHTALKMLSSRKQFPCCLNIFTMYGQRLPKDKVIFSCLINAALESGANDLAMVMIGCYQDCDLEPCDYVTVFRAYVAVGDVDQAERLFKFLGQKSTPLMLNLLLLACINTKQPERALNLLAAGHACEDIPSRRVVDAIAYNTVIKGFVAHGNLQQCFECLRCMQERNLEPDDVTLTSLLEICLAERQPAAIDRVVKLLVQEGRVLEAGTCNLFVRGLIRVGRLPKAMEIYSTMKASEQNRSQPTIVTYSMIIKALVDAHNFEGALLVVEDMTVVGEVPDEIIFTHLLEGCRHVGNHELGERLFQDMISTGMKPSEYTLTMMVKLYGRCGTFDKAYRLVETWEAEHNQAPSVIHYTCLVSGCVRAKQYEHAWSAYELMEKRGVAPDATMMNTLVPAMRAKQMHDRLLQLARRAKDLGFPSGMLDGIPLQLMAIPGAEKEVRKLKR